MKLIYKYTKRYNNIETSVYDFVVDPDKVNDDQNKWSVIMAEYPFDRKITPHKKFICAHCMKQYKVNDCRLEIHVTNGDYMNSDTLILCPDDKCDGSVLDWLFDE